MRRPGFLRGLPALVLFSLVLAMVLKTFVAQAYFIPSDSMVPTLEDGDRVVVNKMVLLFREPRRGEVVVFDNPSYDAPERSPILDALAWVGEGFGFSGDETKHYIKRVVGLPGEQLEVRDGRVFIDGERLEESYVREARGIDDFGPVDIPGDHYFLMGDNRTHSQDSRFFGTVRGDDIIGRAFLLLWPPSRAGGL